MQPDDSDTTVTASAGPSDKRRIVRNTLANGMSQVVQIAAALAYMPFLIRSFGLEHYGLFVLAGSVAGYFTVLDFGVGASLVKLTAERGGRGGDRELSPVISSALAFYVVVGLVAAAGLVTLGLNAGHIFRFSADETRLVRNLLVAAGVFSLVNWPGLTATNVLAGLQRYDLSARTTLAVTIANVAITLAVIISGEGPLTLLIGTGCVGAAGVVANTFLARRELGNIRVSLARVSGAALGRILGLSWVIFAANLCWVIVYQQTDRVVIAAFLGAAAITMYEAAGKFGGFIGQLVSFANSAVLPAASELYAREESHTLRSLFIRGTKYSLFLVTPAVVMLIVLAEPLLRTWLGPAFAAQALVARLMVSYQLLTAGATVGDAMIVGTGKLKKRLPYIVTLTIANLTLSLILVRSLGVVGVVLGTVIPYVVDFPFRIRFVLRELGIPVSRWLREVVMPAYPALLVPAAVGVLATWLGVLDSLPVVALVAVTGVLAYWATVYAVGLTPVEREQAATYAGSLVQRLRSGWSRG